MTETDGFDPTAFKWRAATSANTTGPHEYTMGPEAADPEAFRRACRIISKQGRRERWSDGRVYTYLELDGRDYWVTRWGAVMLNRRRIEDRPEQEPDPQRHLGSFVGSVEDWLGERVAVLAPTPRRTEPSSR